MNKNCPPGKILNPKTGRCVKVDGKIGMKLSKQICPSDKILNPDTGRCVKLNGKIGKKLQNNIEIEIVFKPGLVPYWNSSLDSGRSLVYLKHKYVWKDDLIENFLIWYNLFVNKMQILFIKHGMQFLNYKVCNKYIVLHFRCPQTYYAQIKTLKLMDNVGVNKIIHLALFPDTNEDNVIQYDNTIYMIECVVIKKICLSK
jgi:hypothetical protein